MTRLTLHDDALRIAVPSRSPATIAAVTSTVTAALLAPTTLVASLLMPAPAAAQTGTDAPVRDADASLTLGDVVVRDTAPGPLATRSVLTSVDRMNAASIETQSVLHAWQLFGQMPGMMLTEFRQGTTSGKFSFRAFNGEGEINAIKLLIDGIPANSNDGNMPYLDLLTTQDIASVEVVRGTNDPRYGLHNIAGNANVLTRLGGTYSEARIGTGSHASHSLQLAKGIEADGFSQNYAIGYQTSNGWRAHSQTEKMSFAGKWFYTPDAGRTTIGLIARTGRHDADEAGYLTLAQSRSDPRMSPAHNASDGGVRRLDQLSAHLDRRVSDRLFWSTKAWYNSYDDKRYVRFSAGVSQQERITDERHHGASTVLTWRPTVAGLRDFALEGGLDMERQDNRSLRFNTNLRTPVTQTRAQQFDFDVYGAYLQAVLKPTDRLKIVPAYRVDSVRGSYTNQLTGAQFDINRYGTVGQPKLSLVYTAAPGWNLYANTGRTFQVGVGTAAYKVNQSEDLRPSINNGWEVGVKFNPVPWLDGRLAAWEQTASNEARRKLNDPSNDAENIGRTRRRGIDLQFNARPTPTTGVWLGYALQNSTILQAETSLPASQGKEIDHVPRALVTAGIDWRPDPQWRLYAAMNAQGDYFLERTNSTGRYGGFVLFNAGASWQASRHVRLEMQVRNLTNRYHEYVWYDGAQSLHAPGEPRSFHVAVTLRD